MVEFKDFNFKLAVIQRLMYEQDVLEPRFDVYEFVKGYTARHIDIEEKGYDIIPEVRHYFEQLEIPSETLSLVEEIDQDGGDEIYLQLYPFWDGEDDVFNIQSADDAALLEFVSRGEFTINGFRNRDVRAGLFGHCSDTSELPRQSGKVTRLLRLLRAHGLIKKVPRTHRYLVTSRGRNIIMPLLQARQTNTSTLRELAA